ncbi:MAG: YlxM family DNA-binding protein [Oscillospiraceae bacterium]|nr:YlxM family DNA-binding protein [Oscillospiraceae bacterium]
MSESRLMQSMLLDFYGALLTEKQRECFDLHFNEDLSLSEIAEQSGISRQGVWDNIRRADAALKDIEAKTGLIGRFSETQDALERLRAKLEEIVRLTDGRARETAAAAVAEIDALNNGGGRDGV